MATISQRRARLMLFVAALTCGNLSSCRQVVDDFIVQATKSGNDAGAACHETGYPPPPRTGRSSPGDGFEFLVALRTIDAGDSGRRDERIGYNIDETCTVSLDTASCAPSDPLDVTIDGPDGIDNALGQITPEYYGSGAITDGLKKEEQAGNDAFLLLVTGYNGQADDPEVTAAMLSGTTREPEGSGVLPKWDGTDAWNVFADWVSDPVTKAPRRIADRAYVSGGILVAEFSELSLASAAYDTALYGNVFTGQVKKESDGYHLESGMRAGRWAMPSVLAFLAYQDKAASQWPDPNDCTIPNDVTYAGAKARACAVADVRAEGDDRRKACDALSIGVAIEGIPARLGDVVTFDENRLCETDTCTAPDAGTADTGAK